MTTEIAIPALEPQIQASLEAMKNFVESSNHSDWTSYNHAKKQFLEEFKAVVAPLEKQKIWKDFVEITESAKAIRKVQEEEGAFAAEMIEKALDSISIEIEQFNPNVKLSHFPLFDKVPAFKALKTSMLASLANYHFLNTKADQIQSLRQELSKTGMRLSVKGKLFDRLSSIGDKIFPAKKGEAAALLDGFKLGVKSFVDKSASEKDGVELLFQIRLIQAFLKNLIIKKQDYEQIKGLIDPIWKKAVIMKDQKEKQLEEASSKSLALKTDIEASFDALKELVDQQKDQEALKLYESLYSKTKDRVLLKNDYRSVKDNLENIVKPTFERSQALANQKLALEKEHEVTLNAKKAAILESLNKASDLESVQKAYQDAICIKMSLDEQYRIRYEYIKNCFQYQKDHEAIQNLYFDVKDLGESIRGSLASSSVDFSLSMSLNEILEDVKNLTQKILKKFE